MSSIFLLTLLNITFILLSLQPSPCLSHSLNMTDDPREQRYTISNYAFFRTIKRLKFKSPELTKIFNIATFNFSLNVDQYLTIRDILGQVYRVNDLQMPLETPYTIIFINSKRAINRLLDEPNGEQLDRLQIDMNIQFMGWLFLAIVILRDKIVEIYTYYTTHTYYIGYLQSAIHLLQCNSPLRSVKTPGLQLEIVLYCTLHRQKYQGVHIKLL